jgi:hypothetical protein
MLNDLTIIGRAEKADFTDIDARRVSVKIDTGADACSIWAEAEEFENGRLHVIFFGEGSDWYTGKEHIFHRGQYKITRVANSFGHKEIRFKVKLKIRLKRRTIIGSFTLANRSNKLYPVLIGRSLLKNKFLVDVSKGNPLRELERMRKQRMHEELLSEKEVKL